MATGSLNLTAVSAVPGDGTASNAGPQRVLQAGTETSPHKSFYMYDFDAATDEHLWWTFALPANYASGGTVRIKWMANATTGSAVWGARIGAITPSDADTPIEHAQAAATTATTATNTTEALRHNETTITPSMDSAAAGDLMFLLIYRDADNASDGLSVDAKLINVSLDYTTT